MLIAAKTPTQETIMRFKIRLNFFIHHPHYKLAALAVFILLFCSCTTTLALIIIL